MLEQGKENEKVSSNFTKERVAILALWFGVLIGVRILLGFVLHDVWIGTMGAVGITFAIFYVTLRFTRLDRYRQVVNTALALWYKKKFFYVSGMVSLFVLASILGLIQYGHAYYADRLITVQLNEQELGQSLQVLSASTSEQMRSILVENLKRYSPIEIMAITLASADKTLDGHYAKVVSYLFAEDIEIMIFMLLFRTRKEILLFSRD